MNAVLSVKTDIDAIGNGDVCLEGREIMFFENQDLFVNLDIIRFLEALI